MLNPNVSKARMRLTLAPGIPTGLSAIQVVRRHPHNVQHRGRGLFAESDSGTAVLRVDEFGVVQPDESDVADNMSGIDASESDTNAGIDSLELDAIMPEWFDDKCHIRKPFEPSCDHMRTNVRIEDEANKCAVMPCTRARWHVN